MRHWVSGRCVAPRHPRLRKSIRAQRPATPLFGHEHGGRPPHTEIGHRTPGRGADRHRRCAQDAPRRGGRGHGERDSARRRECGDDAPARLEEECRGGREAEIGRHSCDQRALEPEARDQEEARANRAGDRSQRIRCIDAGARGPGGIGPECEHAHRERERRADAERWREQRDRAGADVGPDRGNAAQLHPVGERGDPVHDRERRE